MALTDDNGGMNYSMPVQPFAYGNGGGFGNGFGGDGAWFLLFLLLICGGNGWGNGFGGGGIGGFAADGAVLYPWMNQSNQINDGFRDQMLNSNITGIQNAVTSGFGDTALGIAGINQNICQTGNGIIGAVNGSTNAITGQMYANTIADLERSFASQTANTQAITGLQSQLAQCCCDQRLATCQTQNVVQNEGNATRYADANNTRDIIDSQTRGTQAILDKLCQLELDGVKGQLAQAERENVGLQNQLNMATMQASQVAQTATFQQGLNNEVDALYNRLKNCPVPTQPVYGNQPIFTCNGNNGGCGCGSF